MAGIPRRDKGAAAIVPESNEVVRQVNSMNAPESVQATGLDLEPNKDLYVAAHSANFGNIVQGMAAYVGNRRGYVKSKTFTGVNPNEVLASVTVGYKDKKGVEETKVYTAADLASDSTLFFQKERV